MLLLENLAVIRLLNKFSPLLTPKYPLQRSREPYLEKFSPSLSASRAVYLPFHGVLFVADCMSPKSSIRKKTVP
jgi:hypothetical protein